jgi:hypothetical protein
MIEIPHFFYIYMYVCMYVCKYVCIYVCVYVCVFVCLHVCMYVCMQVCMYVCMHVCMLCYVMLCMHVMYACYVMSCHVMYVGRYVCMIDIWCIYIYVYTYTRIYAYIYIVQDCMSWSWWMFFDISKLLQNSHGLCDGSSGWPGRTGGTGNRNGTTTAGWYTMGSLAGLYFHTNPCTSRSVDSPNSGLSIMNYTWLDD